MHALAHTYQFLSTPWGSALDHYEVLTLRSRVDWTSARGNEQIVFVCVQNCSIKDVKVPSLSQENA